jgi:hypothetical protein
MFSLLVSALVGAAAVQAAPLVQRSGGVVCGATHIYNYTVVSGDTLGALAYKFQGGICDIASYNKCATPPG